ncbi:MAG: hypothetical protein ACJAW3_000431 [Lentimonas sp.]|jgi:uncharacterized protein (TIGR02186 family)
MKKTSFIPKLIILLTLVFFGAEELHARPIISGISTNKINIDTKFTGVEVLLFGAKGDAGDIIVTIRGPKKDYMVSKKGKFLGVWFNKYRLKFNDAYSYHAFFSSDEDSKINEKLLSHLEISKEKMEFNYQENDFNQEEFKLEFINKLEKKELYSTNHGEISFLDESLFKAILKFPKHISKGTYIVDIYLVDGGNLIAFQAIPIYVHQIGISAKINDFAYENSILYAFAAILIAVIAGFLANFIFVRLFK